MKPILEIAADLRELHGEHSTRAIVRHGGGVFDADFEPPLGWVHVEADDALGWFDDDAEYAANVSAHWTWYCPATESAAPTPGRRRLPRDGGAQWWGAYRAVGANGSAVGTAAFETWLEMRDASFGPGGPTVGLRAIVPIECAYRAGIAKRPPRLECGDEVELSPSFINGDDLWHVPREWASEQLFVYELELQVGGALHVGIAPVGTDSFRWVLDTDLEKVR